MSNGKIVPYIRICRSFLAISKINMNDFFCSTLSCLIFIKNLLTSYWLIVLLPQRYIIIFCKTRVRAQNAILVIPCNSLVRIEDTALKWSLIVHVGCINENNGKNLILGYLKYMIMFVNMQYDFAYL